MSELKLSICIPTYNRREYIGDAIKSIIDQVDDSISSKIEICISDNASTDGTFALIEGIQKNTPVRIVYACNERNMGADVNYLRVVEIASGDYCWFFGSDDIMLPGSLCKILQEIKNGDDIYLCNRIDCDITMKSISENFWLEKKTPARVFDLVNPVQFKRYTLLSTSIGALFSYLSSIIFRRQKWLEIECDPKFIGTAYVHVFMLLSFIKNGCRLKYLRYHLVLCRGGNDSFLPPSKDGIVKRIMIDIHGYLLLANTLFPDSRMYYDGVLRVIRRERPAIGTLAALRIRLDDENWRLISHELLQVGYSKILILFVGNSKAAIQYLKHLRDRIKTAFV